MSKITKFIKDEFEEHQKILAETPEDAHTHVLWLRRLENAQQYLLAHFPDTLKRKQAVQHLHALRQLAGEMLEKRL